MSLAFLASALFWIIASKFNRLLVLCTCWWLLSLIRGRHKSSVHSWTGTLFECYFFACTHRCWRDTFAFCAHPKALILLDQMLLVFLDSIVRCFHDSHCFLNHLNLVLKLFCFQLFHSQSLTTFSQLIKILLLFVLGNRHLINLVIEISEFPLSRLQLDLKISLLDVCDSQLALQLANRAIWRSWLFHLALPEIFTSLRVILSYLPCIL